jgi:hypothetical protein
MVSQGGGLPFVALYGGALDVISGLKFPTFSGSKLPIKTQKNIIHPLRIMLKIRLSLPRDSGKKETKCGLQ